MDDFNRTLSIVITFRCNAKCKNCGTFSNPKQKNKLNFNSIKASIDQAKSIGFNNVVFTGGEATLEKELLLLGIEYAHKKNFPVRLVTNAQWASSEKEAIKSISEFAQAGLDEINYSTGFEHLRFISLENIKNAVSASVKQNLRTVVMIEQVEGRKSVRKQLEDGLEQKCVFKDNHLFSIVESPWMPLNHNMTLPDTVGGAANRKNIDSKKGCESILQTYVVQSDGKIASCCGLGMRNIDDLHTGSFESHQEIDLRSAIDKAEIDVFKRILRYIGPERVLAFVSDKEVGIEWENKYSHRCHACIRIYQDIEVQKVIKEHFEELIPEMISLEYFEKHAIPKMIKAAVEERVPETV